MKKLEHVIRNLKGKYKRRIEKATKKMLYRNLAKELCTPSTSNPSYWNPKMGRILLSAGLISGFIPAPAVQIIVYEQSEESSTQTMISNEFEGILEKRILDMFEPIKIANRLIGGEGEFYFPRVGRDLSRKFYQGNYEGDKEVIYWKGKSGWYRNNIVWIKDKESDKLRIKYGENIPIQQKEIPFTVQNLQKLSIDVDVGEEYAEGFGFWPSEPISALIYRNRIEGKSQAEEFITKAQEYFISLRSAKK